MAYKQLQTLDADKTITIGGQDKKTGKKNPTSIEGFYLGNRTVETNGKYNNGPSVLYFFQTSEGNVGVWGKTDLKKKLSAGKLGLMTLITYSGMKPTPKGEMHTYKVQQDPDVSIDVSDLNSADAPTSEFDSGGTDELSYEEPTDEEIDEEVEYEAPAPVAQQQSAAERKAKVQALLNKRK